MLGSGISSSSVQQSFKAAVAWRKKVNSKSVGTFIVDDVYVSGFTAGLCEESQLIDGCCNDR